MTNVSALPVRVRPVPFEARESVERRLAQANSIPDKAWRRGFNILLRGEADSATARETLVETLGSLQPGHFAHQRTLLPSHSDSSSCVNCRTGLTLRFACTSCTKGAVAAQWEHDGPRVCRRHMRWIGPGVPPNEQEPVGVEALRADRLYRRLRRRGVLDAHRLTELLQCVDRWVAAECATEISRPSRFCLAVQLAQRLLPTNVLTPLADTSTSASERWERLCRAVEAVADNRPCLVLVDLLWGIIRALPWQAQTEHSYRVDAGQLGSGDGDDSGVWRTCRYPKREDLHLKQFVTSERGGTRFDLVVRAETTNLYVCCKGHPFRNRLRALGVARSEWGCVYCARKRLLLGFNTLADTHPNIAAEWHPSLNGQLTPTDVMSGSGRRVIWLCLEGHAYVQTPSERARGVGCGYCAGYLADPETNALSKTHPRLAAEWNYARNGRRTPDNIVAGSAHACWWTCANGHDFRMPLVVRTVHGSGCPFCSGRAVHPTTSLQTVRPDIAALWHPTLNGDLSPADVVPGSGRRVWWRCARGHDLSGVVLVKVKHPGCSVCKAETAVEKSLARTHPRIAGEFDEELNPGLSVETLRANMSRDIWWRCQRGHAFRATINARANKNQNCPICGNRRVLQGFNDLATTSPDLAAQFDGERNGGLTARDVTAGSSKKVWWRCTCGHRWEAVVCSRSRGCGCPVCARNRTVAGVNDMATTHPGLAKQWHSSANGGSSPLRVRAGTPRMIWWVCPCGHSWRESGAGRLRRDTRCRKCHRSATDPG